MLCLALIWAPLLFCWLSQGYSALPTSLFLPGNQRGFFLDNSRFHCRFTTKEQCLRESDSLPISSAEQAGRQPGSTTQLRGLQSGHPAPRQIRPLLRTGSSRGQLSSRDSAEAGNSSSTHDSQNSTSEEQGYFCTASQLSATAKPLLPFERLRLQADVLAASSLPAREHLLLPGPARAAARAVHPRAASAKSIWVSANAMKKGVSPGRAIQSQRACPGEAVGSLWLTCASLQLSLPLGRHWSLETCTSTFFAGHAGPHPSKRPLCHSLASRDTVRAALCGHCPETGHAVEKKLCYGSV